MTTTCRSDHRVLSIDIETYSDIDIKNGVYRYVDSPEFRILLCAYAWDDEPVQIVDLENEEELPEEFQEALFSLSVEKHAFNASFERVCFSKHLGMPVGEYLDPKGWWCTQTHAALCGLPASLKDVAIALNLDEQKDTAGTNLINFFSKPARNGTRHLPSDAPDRWERFKYYCTQDVRTEMAISKWCQTHYTPNIESEKHGWQVNERVNDNGILIDKKLCQAIVEYNAAFTERQVARAKEITGLDNPNSVSQLLEWLGERGISSSSLTKDTIPLIIESTDDEEVKEMLKIRQSLSATSVTKYQRMLDAACSDGKVRGVMKFYGANRTGRFAGRIIQTQNFPKPHIPADELDAVRELVKAKEWDKIEQQFPDIQDLFKQLLRTAMIASPGFVFSIADYSAIEARVSAWMAHETWAEEEFHGDGKIYEATASQMFNVPIETIAKGKENYELRQRGKVATLACGYGGGAGAMAAMDSGHKIDPDDYPELVAKWRKANPHIVQYWYTLEQTVKTAIMTGKTYRIGEDNRSVTIRYKHNNLYVKLPSGRWLTYYQARIDNGQVTYLGNDSQKGWYRMSTFGGKLFENLIQAIARDCIEDSIEALDQAGFRVLFHVHDEIICEAPADLEEEYMQKQTDIMTADNTWGDGLYHPAPGFTTPYYTKD